MRSYLAGRIVLKIESALLDRLAHKPSIDRFLSLVLGL
jgi:hypothetical protein